MNNINQLGLWKEKHFPLCWENTQSNFPIFRNVFPIFFKTFFSPVAYFFCFRSSSVHRNVAENRYDSFSRSDIFMKKVLHGRDGFFRHGHLAFIWEVLNETRQPCHKEWSIFCENCSKKFFLIRRCPYFICCKVEEHEQWRKPFTTNFIYREKNRGNFIFKKTEWEKIYFNFLGFGWAFGIWFVFVSLNFLQLVSCRKMENWREWDKGKWPISFTFPIHFNLT